MSWLTQLANKAEDLLNTIDENTANALNTANIPESTARSYSLNGLVKNLIIIQMNSLIYIEYQYIYIYVCIYIHATNQCRQRQNEYGTEYDHAAKVNTNYGSKQDEGTYVLTNANEQWTPNSQKVANPKTIITKSSKAKKPDAHNDDDLIDVSLALSL